MSRFHGWPAPNSEANADNSHTPTASYASEFGGPHYCAGTQQPYPGSVSQQDCHPEQAMTAHGFYGHSGWQDSNPPSTHATTGLAGHSPATQTPYGQTPYGQMPYGQQVPVDGHGYRGAAGPHAQSTFAHRRVWLLRIPANESTSADTGLLRPLRPPRHNPILLTAESPRPLSPWLPSQPVPHPRTHGTSCIRLQLDVAWSDVFGCTSVTVLRLTLAESLPCWRPSYHRPCAETH